MKQKFRNTKLNDGYNVLSLFDGPSCGLLAFKEEGIKVNRYISSEIDKYAIQISEKNHPEIERLGDVTSIDLSKLPFIDVIIGGSPCQSFSPAGDRTGFDGKSNLYWQFSGIYKKLRKVNPNIKFFLENVKMKKKWRDVISNDLGVEPILLNSSNFSAQSRERLYWTNIKVDKSIFNARCADVIADVLGVDVVKERVNKIITTKKEFKVKVRVNHIDKKDLAAFLRRHKNNTISNIAEACGVSKSMAEHWFRLDSSFSIPSADVWLILKEFLGIKDDSYDCRVMDFEYKNSSYDMAKRIYHVDGKHPTLTTGSGGCKKKNITNGKDMFFLTPNHAEKLQTLPVDYTLGVSSAQRFKMCGNGWNVKTIRAFFKFLNEK